MKLSKRLELLAYLVEKHKKGNILADIGTDHAYLPCYLVEKNIIEKAYACDVAKGPFAASLSTIRQYHFEENVEALLGDGLDPIHDKKVDMVTIAGMGSFLIVEILEKNKAYLNKVKQFYLQPNANTDHLRKYLFKNHFKIIDEKMIKDGHHVYEMMVIENTNQDIQYNQEDMMFGPVLRKNKDELFNNRIDRITNISILKEKMRRPIIDIKGLKAGFDLSKYMSEHLYMFSGEIAPVTFCVEKIYVDDVIDWFGKDIQLFNENKSEVTVRVRTNLYAMKIWAIQYGTHVRVLKPQKLVDWIKSDLQKTLKGYER